MAREEEILEIRWSKEIEFTEINEDTKIAMHYGLYLILETGFKSSRRKQYGDKDKELIYIGIVKSNLRDFFTRMQEHRKEWLHGIAKGQIFFKFGILYSLTEITDQMIEDAESALVFQHQPSENTSKVKSYTITKDIIVKNINHGGYLKPTVRTKEHTG